MNNQELIWNLEENILEICKQENLQCLRGIDNSHTIKGKQIFSWHLETARKCRIKYKSHFDYFKNIDDLVLCSNEIQYFTAHLFLYRPFINNPLKSPVSLGNSVIYPNRQNLEASRYYMFSDIVCEKNYNYWDRIGDLIASFFPDLIKAERVFFSTAIDIIPKEYHSIESYIWLKTFRENEYHTLNEKRKQVVHYNSSDIDERYKHLTNSSDRVAIELWVKERNEIADYFKEQINLTIDGFYNTITLLEKINETLFVDIE